MRSAVSCCVSSAVVCWRIPCKHLVSTCSGVLLHAYMCMRLCVSPTGVGMGCGSESELLEWCVREMKCPMDNLPLDASQVQKPRSVAPHAHAVRHAWPHVAISRAGSRIIINMLGELKRYCPYKDNGCEWQGELERVATHAKVRRRTRRGHPSCTLDRHVVTKTSVHAPTHSPARTPRRTFCSNALHGATRRLTSFGVR